MKRAVFLLCLLAGYGPLNVAAHSFDFPIAEIRKNADKLEMFPLEYDSSNQAVIRFLDPAKTYFSYEGRRYFGFRFMSPATIEGDFAWMYLLRSAHGPTSTGGSPWIVLRRKGEMKTEEQSFSLRKVSSYPQLQGKFPHTQNLKIQFIEKEAFLPNEEYLIALTLEEGDNMVEFALAFCFMEKGQKNRVTRMPLGPREAQPSSRETDVIATSYEGDPW